MDDDYIYTVAKSDIKVKSYTRNILRAFLSNAASANESFKQIQLYRKILIFLPGGSEE